MWTCACPVLSLVKYSHFRTNRTCKLACDKTLFFTAKDIGESDSLSGMRRITSLYVWKLKKYDWPNTAFGPLIRNKQSEFTFARMWLRLALGP